MKSLNASLVVAAVFVAAVLAGTIQAEPSAKTGSASADPQQRVVATLDWMTKHFKKLEAEMASLQLQMQTLRQAPPSANASAATDSQQKVVATLDWMTKHFKKLEAEMASLQLQVQTLRHAAPSANASASAVQEGLAMKLDLMNARLRTMQGEMDGLTQRLKNQEARPTVGADWESRLQSLEIGFAQSQSQTNAELARLRSELAAYAAGERQEREALTSEIGKTLSSLDRNVMDVVIGMKMKELADERKRAYVPETPGLESNPEADRSFALGLLAQQRGSRAEAEAHFRAALREHWGHPSVADQYRIALARSLLRDR